MFKKWIKNVFGKPEEDEGENLIRLGEQLKNADLDYKFAQLFTHSGGYFNYCADESEALHTLYQIIKAEQIQNVFCCDDVLQKFLDAISVPHEDQITADQDAAFITCEYLIAYDGRIMLSHNNIQHFQASTLPKKIIFIANVSQIVRDLNEAMMKIKRQGNVKNLTSVSGKNSHLDGMGKSDTKLFLLLLED